MTSKHQQKHIMQAPISFDNKEFITKDASGQHYRLTPNTKRTPRSFQYRRCDVLGTIMPRVRQSKKERLAIRREDRFLNQD
jgi:hypothetical protein